MKVLAIAATCPGCKNRACLEHHRRRRSHGFELPQSVFATGYAQAPLQCNARSRRVDNRRGRRRRNGGRWRAVGGETRSASAASSTSPIADPPSIPPIPVPRAGAGRCSGSHDLHLRQDSPRLAVRAGSRGSKRGGRADSMVRTVPQPHRLGGWTNAFEPTQSVFAFRNSNTPLQCGARSRRVDDCRDHRRRDGAGISDRPRLVRRESHTWRGGVDAPRRRDRPR